jgi:putative DNA primase/helicase
LAVGASADFERSDRIGYEDGNMTVLTEPSIAQRYLDEWIEGSGVSEMITRLNLVPLDDPHEIKRLLNYKPKERWQHWKHGPGWWVSGVDPESGERTEQGGQFKPDIPIPVYEDGQPKLKKDGTPETRKYCSANDYEAQPLFLDTGNRNYWRSVMDDVSIPICITEGAKKAGAGLTVGTATISIPGVTNGQLKGRLKELLKLFCRVGRRVYLAFDADLLVNPQVRAALDKLGRLISQWGAVVYIVTWSPDLKGMDDYIVTHGRIAWQSRLDSAQTFEEWREENGNFRSSGKKSRGDWEAEKHFTQEVEESLYGDKPWVCIKDVLHYWTGTHYEPSPDAIERRRIREFCNNHTQTVFSKGEGPKLVHKYATPGYVNQALEWVKQGCAIDPNTVNPPGLNCTNGVLQIVWTNSKPSWKVEPHDSRKVYIYAPVATYKPGADPTYCERLLACLDAPQLQIFLKTIAAALDMDAVRKHKGRLVRALLLKGDGNNGKDTLRELVAALFGYNGMTSCSFADCKQYDEGRKFPLAKLGMSRVNWASENQDTLALDKLQVLKAVITGEPLDVEHKGKDDFSITPRCAMLFNVNETPSITAALEAIQSRYGILKFTKTFKTNPDPTRGELQADPRFKYDRDFLQQEVLPAFLNRVLQALVDLIEDGIDYSPVDGAIEEAREASSHLYLFAREVGLVYHPGATVYVGEVWERLKEWYIDNGTLTIEVNEKGKEKSIWIDQTNRQDSNVKGAHQLVSKLQKLYPKIKRGNRSNGNGIPLSGLGWKDDEFADLRNLSVEIEGDPPVTLGRSSGDPTSQAQNRAVTDISSSGDPITTFQTQNSENLEKQRNGNAEIFSKNGREGSPDAENLTPQELESLDIGSPEDHPSRTGGSPEKTNEKFPKSIKPPEIGDIVLAVTGKALWSRKGSDRFPDNLWRELSKRYQSLSVIPVRELEGDIFYELIDESEVEGFSQDGTKIRVRNLKTGRRSVFGSNQVEVLRKKEVPNADET